MRVACRRNLPHIAYHHNTVAVLHKNKGDRDPATNPHNHHDDAPASSTERPTLIGTTYSGCWGSRYRSIFPGSTGKRASAKQRSTVEVKLVNADHTRRHNAAVICWVRPVGYRRSFKRGFGSPPNSLVQLSVYFNVFRATTLCRVGGCD